MLYNRIKLYAVAVLVFILFESVPTFIHTAITKHRICAEHGDVLHAESTNPNVFISLKDFEIAQQDDTPLSPIHHEHCSLVYQAQKFHIIHTLLEFQLHEQIQEQISCPCHTNILQNISLAFLAPKLSPPANI